MQQSLLKLSPLQGTIIAMVVIATLGVTMIAWGFVPHLSLIIVILGLLLFGSGNCFWGHAKPNDQRCGDRHGSNLLVFIYWAVGFGANDVRHNSHADLLGRVEHSLHQP